MKHLSAILFVAAALPLNALAQTSMPGGTPPKSPPETIKPAVPGAHKGTLEDKTGGNSAASLSPFDKNKDGFVSRDEAKASKQLSSQFSKLDKNHDGKLSESELHASSGASSSSATGTGGSSKSKY